MMKLILLGLILNSLAQNQLYNVASDGLAPFESELDSFKLPPSVTEYGYGFWFRFLTTYPKRLPQGKNAAWYFMARLTINKDYRDIGFGDRLLTIYQGQGYYYFTTCNTKDRNPDVHTQVDYPKDIEGLWTYIYYSHSKVLNRSVGFIQYGNQQPPSRVQLDVTHPNIKYLRFILAGQQFQMPGVNGQIYNLVFSVNAGSFFDDQAQFLEQAGLVPNYDSTYLVQFNQLNQIQNFSTGQGEQYVQIGGGKNAFPIEYSVSGWFKWSGTYLGEWHLVFRLSDYDLNNIADLSKLGDRNLAVFANKNNYYTGATYNYDDMNGNGNPNVYQSIQHQGQIQSWHFLYFGYSQYESRAFLFFQNQDLKLSQDYLNTHHYLRESFYFSLRDNYYPNYMGSIDLLNVNLGKGAFLAIKDSYYKVNDVFQYQFGQNNLVTNKTFNSD